MWQIKKKSIYRILKIFGAIALLVVITTISVDIYLSAYIKNKLNAAFSGGGVQFSIENVHVNILVGNITATTPHILLPKKDGSHTEFKAKSLTVWGANIFQFFFYNKINVHKVVLNEPEIVMVYGRGTDSGKRSHDISSLYELIAPQYISIYIHHLQINKGRLRFDKNDGSGFHVVCDSFNFTFDKIFSDSASAVAGTFCNVEDMAFNIRNVKGRFYDNLYAFSVPALTYSKKKNILILHSASLTPTVKRELFSSASGAREDCMNVQLGETHIHISHVDEIFQQKSLLLDSVAIRNIHLTDYVDDNIPLKPDTFVLPYDFLRKLPFKINVPVITLHNGDVVYDELVKHGKTPGRATFNNIQGTLTGLSNTNKRDSMRLHVSSHIMQQALTTMDISFSLSSNEIYARAKMGPYEIPVFNPIIKNYNDLQVESGHAENLTMSCHMNETAADGEMIFTFRDFEVASTLKDITSIKALNPFQILVARFVVRRNNPGTNQLRIGKIKCKREPQNNFIAYMWRSVFGGIESSVGLRFNAEKEKLTSK